MKEAPPSLCLSICLSVSLTDTPTHHWRQQANPPLLHPRPPQLTSNYVMRKSCVPLKSSLNQTQLIPLFSLIVLCKERVFPIRLLTPAVALSDLLGCRSEIIDSTINQLVDGDSVVFNEHSNCGLEVSQSSYCYVQARKQPLILRSDIILGYPSCPIHELILKFWVQVRVKSQYALVLHVCCVFI